MLNSVYDMFLCFLIFGIFVCQVISDYRVPPNTEISRDLEIHIRPDIR